MERQNAIRRSLTLAIALILLVSLAAAAPGDVGSASYTGNSFNTGIDTNDETIEDATFGSNGSKMYLVTERATTGDSGTIYEYNLSTPYDATTATLNNSKSIGNSVYSIVWKPDGTTFFILRYVSNDDWQIRQYSVDTEWSIDTITLDESFNNLPTASPSGGLDIADGGTKMFVRRDSLRQYTLTEAYNVSTATFVRSDSLGSRQEIEFNSTGKRMYSSSGSSVNQHDLDEAWNISSGTSAGSKDISGETSTANGFAFNDERSVMVVTSGQDNNVYEYFLTNSTLNGTVKDSSGDPIEGATVAINISDADQVTGADGTYRFAVDNGTYELTTTHPDFDTNTTVVNVTGDTTQDITLFEPSVLSLDVNPYMEHGTTQTYVVLDGSTDVSGEATVTSSNSTAITVNTTSQELEAIDDNLEAQRVTISATYEGKTVTQNVTVANKTLDNFAILPPTTWPYAVFGFPGDTTGQSDSWPGAVQLQWLFVSLSFGAVVKWRSRNPFMGLTTVMILLGTGWAISWISNGMIIAAIIFLLYAALSLTDIASGNLGRN